MSLEKTEITMISTLPPIIGLTPYTKGLVEELSKIVKVNFLGFNHIYPKFLYPGKISDESLIPLPETENLRIRNVLNWYNPFGWIIEAFRIKTDIIHGQWWSFPLAFIYFTILGICKLRGKKIILTIHNVMPHEMNFLKVCMNKSIFFMGDEYIVHTQKNKDALEKIIKKKPIHIIPHGLIENPLKGISKEDAREQLGIAAEDKILLCFGHIRDYKGIDTAIEALSLIEDPSVKLIIAGKCWEDWKKYEELIDKFGMQERIILKLGFIPVDQTEVIFRASDLVLLPYKHFDAQSGVGALVLPFGIPMIVSNTGGLTDYVKNDVCIIEPGNAKELASNVAQILDNREIYEEIQRDIQEVKQELSWDKIAERTEEEVY